MPRIRTIKPSFFMSRSVKRLTDKQKLVWLGLFPNADDEGRLLDEPGILVGQLWALTITEPKLDLILTDLDAAQRIIRYEVAGERYIQVTNWHEHQKISKPTPSVIPPVPVGYDSRNPPGVLPRGREGKGKEQEGSAQSASPFCVKHPNGTDQSCRACGNARRAYDAALAAVKAKPTVPGIVTEPDCDKHPYYPARGCPRCAEEA